MIDIEPEHEETEYSEYIDTEDNALESFIWGAILTILPLIMAAIFLFYDNNI